MFINYYHVGRVKSVGTVYMSYNRGGMRTQVGGLQLTYSQSSNMHHIYIFSHSSGYAYSTNDYLDTDNNYYYYIKDDNVKKPKKIKKYLLNVEHKSQSSFPKGLGIF